MSLRGLTSSPVRKSSRAIGVPTVQVRVTKEGRAEKETPNWARLQKHIERHEKAGGVAKIVTTRFDDAQMVEGRLIIEMVNVELSWPGSL